MCFSGAVTDIVSFICEIIEMFYDQPGLFREVFTVDRAYCSRWDKYSIVIRKCRAGQYSLVIYENKLLIGTSRETVKQLKKAVNKAEYLG